MRKYIVPVVLLVAVIALIAYLRFEDFKPSDIDANAYLTARQKVDSLEQELYEAKDNVELKISIRKELNSAWETLENIREPENEVSLSNEQAEKPESLKDFAQEKVLFIVGGIFICLILITVIVVLLRKASKKRGVDSLEAQKAALSNAKNEEEPLVIEERFRNPKGGFSDDDLTFTRVRGSKRPSIIDEASAYAEAEREKEKQKEEELASEASTSMPSAQTAASFAFEDSDGIPENRIMSTTPGSTKPPLRPTAKERITSALQNLSSALTRPRGISRDQTMHLRTQSHNTMIGMRSVGGSVSKSPLDVTRFDKEKADLTTVKKLKGQGCTPGMIAQKMNISQKDAETLISKVRESEN